MASPLKLREVKLEKTTSSLLRVFSDIIKDMILIVGLGNPGKNYKLTRHNIGFRVLDRFLKKNRFPEFKSSKKFKSSISRDSLNGKRIILAQPKTFMNNSGKAVKLLAKRYTPLITKQSQGAKRLIYNSKNLIVIHDDIDLNLGQIKIVKNKGAGGHKGVQSIINEIKTKNFVRFRIGIKPKTYTLKRENLEEFVLKKFTKTEKEVINNSVKICLKALELTLKEGLAKAMNEFN